MGFIPEEIDSSPQSGSGSTLGRGRRDVRTGPWEDTSSTHGSLWERPSVCRTSLVPLPVAPPSSSLPSPSIPPDSLPFPPLSFPLVTPFCPSWKKL